MEECLFCKKTKLEEYYCREGILYKVCTYIEKIWFYGILGVIGIILLLWINEKQGNFTKCYLKDLESSISNAVAVAGIAFAVFIFYSSSRSEEVYFIQTKKDVIEKYKIKKWIFLLLVATFTMNICQGITQNVSEEHFIFPWAIILIQSSWILLLWSSIFIIGKVIYLSTNKDEIKAKTIKDLHKIFWVNKYVKCSEITAGAIYQCLANWGEDYRKLYWKKTLIGIP